MANNVPTEWKPAYKKEAPLEADTSGGYSNRGFDFSNKLTQLRVLSGKYSFRVDSQGLYMGSEQFGTAPFSVTPAGILTCTNGIVYGGVTRYGKTTFADSTNAGYYIGTEGLYFGSAADAVKSKYTIASGVYDIIATSINKLTLTALATGFSIAGGTTSKTLTVPLNASVSGTNTGDQDLSGYVPYTGASSDVNLGAHSFTIASDSKKLYFGASSDMTVWYDGTYGQIKTSDVAASDLKITCGALKTIELQNTVYDDLQFQVSYAKVPAANYPTWETFTTNTQEYAFSVNDYIDTAANEIPHWWKQGTEGHAHMHFTIKTIQNSGATQYAKFTVTFAYADTDEVWVEQALTAEQAIANGTAALTNFYLDLGGLTFTNYLIGAQVKCRIKRIAATTGTEYADDVYITQVGIHLEKDTMGSRQEIIK